MVEWINKEGNFFLLFGENDVQCYNFSVLFNPNLFYQTTWFFIASFQKPIKSRKDAEFSFHVCYFQTY